MRRKAQKAIASTYVQTDPPKSLDSSTLTALRQGQQTILRTPATTVCGATVERDDPGCCCNYPPVTITNITQQQTSPRITVSVFWIDDPDAISYETVLDTVEGTAGDGALFEEPTRSSVSGLLPSSIQRFRIGIRAVYPCGIVVSWTDVQTLTGSA